MWRHQQVDRLLRQAGPNLVELPLQFYIVQTLSQNPCGDVAAHMSRQICTDIMPTIIINIQAWPGTTCNQDYVIWTLTARITIIPLEKVQLDYSLSHLREVIFKESCIWITFPTIPHPQELRQSASPFLIQISTIPVHPLLLPSPFLLSSKWLTTGVARCENSKGIFGVVNIARALNTHN